MILFFLAPLILLIFIFVPMLTNEDSHGYREPKISVAKTLVWVATIHATLTLGILSAVGMLNYSNAYVWQAVIIWGSISILAYIIAAIRGAYVAGQNNS